MKKKKPSVERGVKTLLSIIAELIITAQSSPRADCTCSACVRGNAAIKRGKDVLELMESMR